MNSPNTKRESHNDNPIASLSTDCILSLPPRCPDGKWKKTEQEIIGTISIPKISTIATRQEERQKVDRLISKNKPIGLRVVVSAKEASVPSWIMEPMLKQSRKRKSKLGVITYEEDQNFVEAIIATENVFKEHGLEDFHRLVY